MELSNKENSVSSGHQADRQQYGGVIAAGERIKSESYEGRWTVVFQ